MLFLCLKNFDAIYSGPARPESVNKDISSKYRLPCGSNTFLMFPFPCMICIPHQERKLGRSN